MATLKRNRQQNKMIDITPYDSQIEVWWRSAQLYKTTINEQDLSTKNPSIMAPAIEKAERLIERKSIPRVGGRFFYSINYSEDTNKSLLSNRYRLGVKFLREFELEYDDRFRRSLSNTNTDPKKHIVISTQTKVHNHLAVDNKDIPRIEILREISIRRSHNKAFTKSQLSKVFDVLYDIGTWHNELVELVMDYMPD